MKLAQKFAVAYIRTKLKLWGVLSKKKAAASAFNLFCTPRIRSIKELPPVFETAEKIQFAFQHYQISGYRWNNGAGRRALIVHGFESSATNFANYITPLLDKGYEVLAFDAPAHGRSSGKTMNALLFRDFIIEICHRYGPVESFIAHSFGGLAVCMAIAEMPHDRNWKIALVAPAAETKTAIDQFFKLINISHKGIRAEFEEIITHLSGESISWFSIRRALKKIKAQILWVHDEDDDVTPLQDAGQIRAEKPDNIEFLITTGLGHRKIYRDPKVGKAIVSFL